MAKEVAVTPELKKYGETLRKNLEDGLTKFRKTLDREIELSIAEVRRVQKICSDGVITEKEWANLRQSILIAMNFAEEKGGFRDKVDNALDNLAESLEKLGNNPKYVALTNKLAEQFKDFPKI